MFDTAQELKKGHTK